MEREYKSFASAIFGGPIDSNKKRIKVKTKDPTAEEILDYLVTKCGLLSKADIKAAKKAIKG